MDIIYYIVPQPIRWDQLADLAYGSVGYMADLLQANPQIGVFNWIPAKAVIGCPVIVNAAINPLGTLPAWKTTNVPAT